MFDVKNFSRIIFFVVLSVIVGAALMIFTYALPRDRVIKNVQADLSTYEREGIAPKWSRSEHSHIDFFTEAIMLDEATHPAEEIIRAAMLNPRYRFADDEKPVDVLIKSMNGDLTDLQEVFYPRYWHGYLVILKPLLMTMRVDNLRIFLAYGVFILFVAALLLTQKILGTPYAFAFAAAAMILNLVTVSLSFQYQAIYFITMSAIIFMLKKNRRLFDDGLYIYFFALVGILIAFFDFLTYPIFSVGMLMTFWYVLNLRGLAGKNLSTIFKMMTSLLIAWGIGYVGMWSGKWIISRLLTGYDTVSNAFTQAATYTLHETIFSAIGKNLATLGDGSIRIFLFAAIIFMLYILISRRKFLTRRKIFPYIFCAALPFVWFAAISGHSYIHAFFTYRGLAVTIFALACLTIEILRCD